jgi:methyl-accepting chemotaxis protein
MMEKLKNLRIGTRLGLAFGLLLIVMIVLIGVSLTRVASIKEHVDIIVEQNNQKTELLNRMQHTVLVQAIAMRNIIVETMDEEKQGQLELIQQNRKQYDDCLAKLTPLVRYERERELLETLKTIRSGINKVIDRATATAVTNRQNEATVLVNRGVGPLQKKWLTALEEFIALQAELNKKAADEVQAQYAGTRLTMMSSAGAFLILGVVLAFFITRSITVPIKQAGATADAIANGKLDNTIEPKTSDEAGWLLQSMKTMQKSLQQFVAAQAEMAKQHEAGEIDHRIAAEQFPGTYGEMAKQINELAASHIALSSRVVKVVERYAQGDFSADMDRLPGKKAQITKAIDGVKASFQAISGEVVKLVDSAARGDFTARGAANKYDYDFRKMVEGLNRLMAVSEDGLSEVVRFLGALAKCDLTKNISNDYEGTFKQLKDDSNLTVEQLQRIIGQIQEATEAINHAAQEIAAGNADLASRTEVQAASLDGTASRMEELTVTVRQNAENAERANQLAIGASDVAVKGGQVVGQVVQTMSSINARSPTSVDIMSVIEVNDRAGGSPAQRNPVTQ